ncbi:hypothetical protein C8J56DRAFT_764466, partial [Mycena floridula]
SPLQQRMHKSLDRMLPFRECAPSRLHITADSGPFSEAHIFTPAGIASALIFRGITFVAPKVKDHCSYFASLNNWTEFRATDPQELNFCNPSAYRWSNGRTSDNAAIYFDVAPKIHDYLNRLAVRKQSTAFRTFWDTLKSSQHVEDIHALTFGALTSLLLAEDLVYAGHLPMPSDQDFAECVAKMDKGAVEGLQKLGMVNTSSSRSDIDTAF